MNNLNSLLIEGNLVRDPQIRETPRGSKVCNFPIASCRYFMDGNGEVTEKEVCFFDIESWGHLAERCYAIGHKGRAVRVVGRLRQDRWISADGKQRARIVVVAEHVEFRPEFKKTNSTEQPEDYLKQFTDIAEIPPEEDIVDEEAIVVEAVA